MDGAPRSTRRYHVREDRCGGRTWPLAPTRRSNPRNPRSLVARPRLCASRRSTPRRSPPSRSRSAAKAEGYYAASPELRLHYALRSAGGTGVRRRLDRPRDPVACDLLPRRVDADVSRQVICHELRTSRVLCGYHGSRTAPTRRSPRPWRRSPLRRRGPGSSRRPRRPAP